jgi:hypothetical protein
MWLMDDGETIYIESMRYKKKYKLTDIQILDFDKYIHFIDFADYYKGEFMPIKIAHNIFYLHLGGDFPYPEVFKAIMSSSGAKEHNQNGLRYREVEELYGKTSAENVRSRITCRWKR